MSASTLPSVDEFMEILKAGNVSTVDEVMVLGEILGMKPLCREDKHQVSLAFSRHSDYPTDRPRFYMVVGPDAVYIPQVHDGYKVRP